MINLFNLHSEKDTPNGWIWVSLKPHLIKKIYSLLLKDFTQDNIGRKISKKLNAGFSTVVKHLIRIKKTTDILSIPLPILIELTNLTKKDYQQDLSDSIINLECKNYNSQTVNPIHEVGPTLAKIIGAHISDGYLQKDNGSYAWKLCEGKKDLIYGLSNWIKDTFGIKARIKYYPPDNMWICSTKNKIFCRFLEKVIKIPLGKKSHIIQEPDMIRKSNLKIRNAFLSGMLNFDGCVKTNGIVSLTSMSKELIFNVKEIFNKNNIKTNITYNNKKKSWIIETSKSRDEETLTRLLNFFEKGTYKYNRLKFFVDKKIHYHFKDLNRIFPKERLSKISLSEVYNVSKKLKKFKTKELAEFCQVSPTTLYKYLHILEKAKMLNKEIKKITTDKYHYQEAIYKLNK